MNSKTGKAQKKTCSLLGEEKEMIGGQELTFRLLGRQRKSRALEVRFTVMMPS